MLIGSGAAALLLLNGKIAGISGIFENTVTGVIGAQAGGLRFSSAWCCPRRYSDWDRSYSRKGCPCWGFRIAGGFGTRLGGGCTSDTAYAGSPISRQDRCCHVDFHDGGHGRPCSSFAMEHFLEFLTALLAGLLFGSGLLLSRMCDPQRVLSFLDVAGHWNPALAFTMGGAILVAAPAFLYVRQRHETYWTSCRASGPVQVQRLLGCRKHRFGIGWGCRELPARDSCCSPAVRFSRSCSSAQ